jgi:hypothetical protein
MKYQVFSVYNPSRVITTVEAPTKEAAQALARRANPDYAVVPVLGKGNAPARESGSRTVQLREAHSLARIFDTVTKAVQSADSGATDIEALDDNTVVYHVGAQMFQRTYRITDGQDGEPAVTLGQPEAVELKVVPAGESMKSFTLRDSATGATFRVAASSEERAKQRLQTLGRLSKALNPGESDSFHENFIRGRDTRSGSTLEDLGRSLGYEGRMLEQFVKGR